MLSELTPMELIKKVNFQQRKIDNLRKSLRRQGLVVLKLNERINEQNKS